MTIINIERRDYNALRACAATNDVRYYLNGIYLDPANQMLVATNGHHMLTIPMADVPVDAPSCIVAIPKMSKLPKKIDHVAINVATRTMDVIDKDGATFFTQAIELIDAKYADWQFVARDVPSWDAKATIKTRMASVPFNPVYLAAVTSALEATAVDMRPGPSRGDVIVSRFQRDATDLECTYYLMPMRL